MSEATTERLRVAVAQMSATDDVDENLDSVAKAARDAAARGCDLLALPENATVLVAPDRKTLHAEPIEGRQIDRCREIARRHGLHLLIGSFPERSDEEGRAYNTTVVLDAGGEILSTYRKMHLFDVDLPPDVQFIESRTVKAGRAEPVVCDIAGWAVGLTICYDLRFPELYRALVERGAEVLAVPSAFTFRTGAAHWEVLLRARAIENQCYVLAPAQVGYHGAIRETYGRAMAIDPWGGVIGQRVTTPGLFVVELERTLLDRVRSELPALRHRRL